MIHGTPPYTVSIAEAGASVINVTLAYEDDTFTYINRAAPNTELFSAYLLLDKNECGSANRFYLILHYAP